jgi:hypothetical protein
LAVREADCHAANVLRKLHDEIGHINITILRFCRGQKLGDDRAQMSKHFVYFRGMRQDKSSQVRVMGRDRQKLRVKMNGFDCWKSHGSIFNRIQMWNQFGSGQGLQLNEQLRLMNIPKTTIRNEEQKHSPEANR